jgi:7-cyano-7-deazaguanine synthase in queuosine biosynthesis/intein/homing endonuclease
MSARRAIVLLSGGLDSATTLAVARDEGFECFALSVAYGQRHSAELNAAAQIASTLGAREHRVMHVDLASIGGSALTDPALDVPETPSEGIPVTYVPARNTMMLSLALAWAEVIGADAIFMGVNARDYSVSGGARVWMRDAAGARLMRMQDACALPPGEYETLAMDRTSLQVGWKRVLARFAHSVSGKRCFRVKLERGQEIEITEDHSLFTIDDSGRILPIRGSELREGVPLVVPFDLSSCAEVWARELEALDLRRSDSQLDRNSNRSIREDGAFLVNRLKRTRVPLEFPVSDEFLRIVGLWLAEGGRREDSRQRKLSFSIGGLPGAPDLLASFFSQFGIAVSKSPLNDFDYRIDSSVACELFQRLGLMGTSKAGDKHFPEWFWALSQRQRRTIVAGLWDGDGCQVWNGEAPISQKSHELIDILYHCLLLDGIFPTVKLAPHGQKRLAITRAADFGRFIELYPLWHREKRQSLAQAAAISGRDKTTGLWKFAELWATVYISELAPGARSRIYNAGGKYENAVRAQRRAFAEVPILQELVASKLAFLRVASVAPVDHSVMYDFSVEEAENFLAEGFVAHNSGYPDCRPEYIEAFQKMADLATKAGVEGRRCQIRTPLINLSKAEIVREGTRLGVDFGATVSCYQADAEGRACGRCDSCRIRREGFAAAGLPDPTRYRPL